MDSLDELYARYDGPPPRPKNFETGPACWHFILQNCLRAIRLKRQNRDWAGMAELTGRVKAIRQRLHAPRK